MNPTMTIQQYYARIREDEQQDKKFLHLTSNEPFMSETARTFAGSRLADRYLMAADDEGIVDLGTLFV